MLIVYLEKLVVYDMASFESFQDANEMLVRFCVKMLTLNIHRLTRMNSSIKYLQEVIKARPSVNNLKPMDAWHLCHLSKYANPNG